MPVGRAWGCQARFVCAGEALGYGPDGLRIDRVTDTLPGGRATPRRVRATLHSSAEFQLTPTHVTSGGRFPRRERRANVGGRAGPPPSGQLPCGGTTSPVGRTDMTTSARLALLFLAFLGLFVATWLLVREPRVPQQTGSRTSTGTTTPNVPSHQAEGSQIKPELLVGT